MGRCPLRWLSESASVTVILTLTLPGDCAGGGRNAGAGGVWRAISGAQRHQHRTRQRSRSCAGFSDFLDAPELAWQRCRSGAELADIGRLRLFTLCVKRRSVTLHLLERIAQRVRITQQQRLTCSEGNKAVAGSDMVAANGTAHLLASKPAALMTSGYTGLGLAVV